jgi:hypothetical protein
MRKLITTLGPIGKEELGLILPHEHIFVDLRTYDQPGFSQADPAAVIKLLGGESISLKPYLTPPIFHWSFQQVFTASRGFPHGLFRPARMNCAIGCRVNWKMKSSIRAFRLVLSSCPPGTTGSPRSNRKFCMLLPAQRVLPEALLAAIAFAGRLCALNSRSLKIAVAAPTVSSGFMPTRNLKYS